MIILELMLMSNYETSNIKEAMCKATALVMTSICLVHLRKELCHFVIESLKLFGTCKC